MHVYIPTRAHGGLGMDWDRENDLLSRACDELIEQNALLQQEIELLRVQLRRHPSGEMQIREAHRQMGEWLETTHGHTPLPSSPLREMAY